MPRHQGVITDPVFIHTGRVHLVSSQIRALPAVVTTTVVWWRAPKPTMRTKYGIARRVLPQSIAGHMVHPSDLHLKCSFTALGHGQPQCVAPSA